MKAEDLISVSPLTSTKLDGTPYARRVDVTAAIERALSLPTEQWVALAGQSGDARLPSEALVYLLRSLSPVNRELIGQLAWQLLKRIEMIVKRWAKGFDQTTTEELLEMVQTKVMALTLASPAGRQRDFLEIAFTLAVKNHTLKAVEKRPKVLMLPLQDDGASHEDDAAPTVELVDDFPQPDEIVQALQDEARQGPLLEVARGAVKDPRHYEALLLHFGHHWQLSSNDPNTQTLETHFKVSRRQIRNWIRNGLEAIRRSMEIQS